MHSRCVMKFASLILATMTITKSPQVPFDDKVPWDNCPAIDNTDVNEWGSHIEENNVVLKLWGQCRRHYQTLCTRN
ncbi:hypothetical protein ACHAW6_013230 [Cyclotella cf. meneghiniana]